MRIPIFIGLTFCILSGSIQALTFSGCFTLPPGFSNPNDVAKLGWTERWNFEQLSLQFCVNHCTNKQKKYAAVMTTKSKTECLCGDEEAFKKLGKADHITASAPCHHAIWSMRTYVALNDYSTQYVGCYKEVADEKNMASNTHNWIDTWMMAPNICIKYCEANGAAYASLRKGDLCTCGDSFAKHGLTADSACNLPCAGNGGMKCGGNLANSVYSTLSFYLPCTTVCLTALDEILQPDTSVSTHGFKPLNPVAVPKTQVLVKNLLDLQTAVSKQVPNKEAKNIGDMLFGAQTLMQDIMEIKGPVEALLKSPGFGMSNAPQTTQWVNGKFPPPLQKFADVIKRSQSFVSVDIKRVVTAVSRVMAISGPLKSATTDTLSKLQNYFANGILITGIDETVRVAMMMVSASRHCVPRLRGNRNIMTKSLEGVSTALIEGPFGTQTYIQNLQNPFVNVKQNKVSAPKIDTKSWRTGLTDIGNSWTAFVSNNGINLYQLIVSKYEVPCPTRATPTQTPTAPARGTTSKSTITQSAGPGDVIGKRSICVNTTEVDFLTMVEAPGDNPAKQAMNKFITDNTVIFDAFKWSTLEKKLQDIIDGVGLVEKYLKDAGISTPKEIQELAKPLTSFKFYQTCVKYMSNLLDNVCHSTDRPVASKVTEIKC